MKNDKLDLKNPVFSNAYIVEVLLKKNCPSVS